MISKPKTGCLICLVALSAFGQVPPAPETGLAGLVRIGPIHPAAVANTVFCVGAANSLVTSFTTDGKGRFHIPLAPGHYTVSLKERKIGIGQCGPFDVDVTAGKVTNVEWLCDNSTAVKIAPESR